uniref:DUF2605 domain-containing protein n=1 Tax=Cyanothece sp. (strain PCC 7425 / ATCC 29141) TaxID=395961 RepID=B8HK46_CYAP4
MFTPNLPEPELLKVLLEPLLEDFEYWFSYTRSKLSAEDLAALSPNQADLLARVDQAYLELQAARSLFAATEGQAGVETTLMFRWHQLVMECWQILNQRRVRGGSQLSK